MVESRGEHNQARKLRRRWVGPTIAAVISVAILVVAWRTFGSAGEVWESLAEARWELAWVPATIVLTNVVLAAVRWRVLLKATGHVLPLGTCLRIVLAAWPAGAITRAGDLLRAYYAAPAVPQAAALSATVAEKLIDIQSLCWIAAIAAAARGLWGFTAMAAVGIAAIWSVPFLGGVVLRHLPREENRSWWIAKLRSVVEAFSAVFAAPKQLGTAVVVSLVAYLNAVLVEASLLWLFGSELRLLDVFWAWPLAVFVGVLPISLAGLGTRDVTFLYLLQATDVAVHDPSKVLLATSSYALFSTFLVALAGLPFMWTMSRAASGR